jgi:hypothetical protein
MPDKTGELLQENDFIEWAKYPHCKGGVFI